MVTVIGPKEPKNSHAINTTSTSQNWSQGLSPFFLGPIALYGGHVARVMENAWQYSKVYPEHLDGDEISNRYWDWAKAGWADTKAHRYPMGKDAKPAFSLWDGERLTYIQARKKVYVPLYAKAVRKTPAFVHLKLLYELMNGEMVLWDFDGYDHRALGMSYDDVINCETRKCGHAFVLAMMLEGIL